MKGKDKCRILKEIRQQIALQNDIDWVVSECSHKGECKGTCPKCESEVRKLERELELRRKLGKAVALTGVSAACMAGLSACTMEDVADYARNVVNNVKDLIGTHPADGYMEVIEGEEEYYPEDYEEEQQGGLGLFQPVTDGKQEPETEEPYMLEGDVPYFPEELELSGYVPVIEEETENIDEVFVTEGEVALDGDW